MIIQRDLLNSIIVKADEIRNNFKPNNKRKIIQSMAQLSSFLNQNLKDLTNELKAIFAQFKISIDKLMSDLDGNKIDLKGAKSTFDEIYNKAKVELGQIAKERRANWSL